MNKREIANSLLRCAKALIGLEFNTKKELEDYKKNHDVKPGTKLTLKKAPEKKESPDKKETPAKKESPEDKEHFSSFNHFEISMTKSQAQSISKPGKDAHDDIVDLLKDPKIKKQLDDLDPKKVREELSEYGAWDDDELEDDAANKIRILWIAGGNIMDNKDEEE
jgi:hypothetical protein